MDLFPEGWYFIAIPPDVEHSTLRFLASPACVRDGGGKFMKAG